LISNPYLLGVEQYLFRHMAEEVHLFREKNTVELLNMGVGDVVKPIAPTVVECIRQATEELAHEGTFKGYPPTEGYGFAREAIAKYYREMGADVSSETVFVGSGAKDELAVWSNVLDSDIHALIPTPAYPLYADIARSVGRAVQTVTGGIDEAEQIKGQHIIYLCSPNNPTGETLDLATLQRWVDHARNTHSIILFDAAYAAFAYPYSIFMCEGANDVCVEIGTLSKSASFSGMRLGWSIIGRKVCDGLAKRAYLKYKSTATNGVSYIVQRAGEAALREEGIQYSRALIDGYRNSATLIGNKLREWGLECTVGPYVWLKLPRDIENPFRTFLERAHLIVTDGAGFGDAGKGCVRLSVFAIGGRENEAIERLKRVVC